MSQAEVTAPRVLGPAQGLILGAPDATDRFMLDSTETSGRLSIVEHTIAPGVLAAPMHRHEHEDEFSYVLEGRVGAIFDGVEVYAAGGPLRILEIITLGGLEELFRLMGAPDASPDLLDAVETSYGCTVDQDQAAALIRRHGLRSWLSGDLAGDLGPGAYL